MKIQSPLFYNTSLQTQARFSTQKKKKNLKKISTKFQCKQNKIQNIGYKCYLGNHWWIPNKKEQNKTNKSQTLI